MKKLLVLSLLALCTAPVFAELVDANTRYGATPVQVSFWSPLHLPAHDREVSGLRFNLLYGRSKTVRGVDLGLCGSVFTGDMKGLELSMFNLVDGSVSGVQFAGLANNVARGLSGVQFATILNATGADSAGLQLALVNHDNAFTGAQIGLVNWSIADVEGFGLGIANVYRNDFTGCSMGLVNYANGRLSGAQIGLINQIRMSSTGLQLGLFNAAQNHVGAQIGLMNLNIHGALTFFPFVNVNF